MAAAQQPLDEYGEQFLTHCLELDDTGAAFDANCKLNLNTTADGCSGLHACDSVNARVSNAGSYPFCTTNCVLHHVHASGRTTKEEVIDAYERFSDQWDARSVPMEGREKGSFIRYSLYRFVHRLLHPAECGHNNTDERVIKPICIMTLITKLSGASGVGFKKAAPKVRTADADEGSRKRAKKSSN